MTLIDTDDLLPKELDLAMIVRDTSSAPPAPETHDGSNTMAQAAQDSPRQNRPPCQGQRVTTTEAEFARLARDTSTLPPALQHHDGADGSNLAAF